MEGLFQHLEGLSIDNYHEFQWVQKYKSRNDDCIIHVLIVWGTMAPNAPSIVASKKFSTRGGGVGPQLVYRLGFQLLQM